ncbi:NAD(P)-binding protein [Aaosphaeria arxii CBS 175.79]|uniref:Short-chain dehydrogenase/reductase 3 n=1 Tax=Aaosphaeria arxii CBS 175.79 TaxID=1450172 RepID=A0A6A5Y6K2_9PLEO|nr:NAD(P)-binding protein [Aaosphaeria arxii CBS 175.79]KAF2020843.1 NAD(P)-binding protein [Aaosphaeria arxii CBS 175.79]
MFRVPGIVLASVVLLTTMVLLLFEANSALNRWADKRWRWGNDVESWNWKEELCVITGGSRGIGAEVVKKLTSHGIRVAILDVEAPLISPEDEGAKLAFFYRCDITSKDAVRKAGQAIRLQHGSASILINNAGIGNANSIMEITPERLRSIFDINLLSHWYTVQEFLPDMLTQRKGHIMSTASMAAFLGLAGMVDYSCTKASLTAFHEGLIQELKHRYKCPEIKTTIVYPNWTKTRLVTAIEEGIRKVKHPIVEPAVVAEAMVQQIIHARSGQLILGPSIAASVRGFPTWLQELIRDSMAQVVTANATSATKQGE